MRPFSFLAAVVAFAASSSAINILITNDDGFASANTRELYRQLSALGHDCYIVAPVTDQSSASGRTLFTNSPILTGDGDWGIVKAGAPSIGTDPHDNHIWYYNGSAATQVLVALDYVLPTFAKFATPDLVLSGPSFGSSNDPLIYSASGTIDAAIIAIKRGIPAIAFSSGNTGAVPYYKINARTRVGLQDPAVITASLASTLVEAFIAEAAGSRVLPEGYGATVNLPFITSDSSGLCTSPPFVFTRMTGNATTDKATYDATTGLFALFGPAGQCLTGNCQSPFQRDTVDARCESSVSLFSVAFDPLHPDACIRYVDFATLMPLVVQLNMTTPPTGITGQNSTVIVILNGSHPSSPSTNPPRPSATITGLGAKSQWSVSALLLGLGVAAFML